MEPTPAPTSPPSSQEGPQQPKDGTMDIDYPAPPQNIDSAPFHVLATLFDKLQSERKPEKRRKLVERWFQHWREEKGYDLYPVLRLILPQKDRERSVYGLKEANLAKTFIKLIPLGRRDPDAIRLLNWKKPTDKEKSAGDFPTVLYEVVSKRSSVIEGTLSIDDLNEVLDELAKNMGKQDAQARILQRVYNNTTPEEQRWIVRIILKGLIISVKETTVFSVFHPDAQDLFNTCSDLKKVAWELWDPSRRLNDEDKSVQLFRPFAPMLCKRPTRKIEETIKEMQGKTFIIEEKLDGERIQLHKQGNEYYYCSRKGKDYTYLYGKHVGAGSLTPFIDSAFDSRIDDIILDGEMLVWDPVSERNLPFGTLKTAALDKSKKEHNPRPCFKVFDLLYLNGQSLATRSVKFRKRNLRACIKEIKGRIEFVTEYEGKTAKDVRQRMDEVMATRGEGLVIKHPEAEYVLNGRNKDWIKVKPEYMDNMGETVDVLVVSANYGTGRRGGGVSTLICAVLDDRRNYDDDDEQKYSTFVRIGTGLSYADYIWIRDKPWKPWNEKEPPSFLQTAKKTHEDKGDVYLEPEDSFIIKIKAAEVVSSDQYHIGFTMRFPRALSIRDDLTVSDCMTASAVLESVRTEKKRKMEGDDGVTGKKKRKLVAKKFSIMPEYQGSKLKDVEVDSDLFEGMKFMVASDPKSKTGDQEKRELLRLIHMHGGGYVQIAKNQENLLVVYGGHTTPYDIKLIMDKGFHDIIRPQWLHDCIAQRRLVPLMKKYFFHATQDRLKNAEYTLDDIIDEDPQNRSGTLDEESSNSIEANKDPKVEISEDVDASMAEWFKVEEDPASASEAPPDTESETDQDSEHDNLDGLEDGVTDWWNIGPDSVAGDLESTERVVRMEEVISQDETLDDPTNVKMGESKDAMHYDEDAIFKHLCFYLDSPDNASRYGMTVKSKHGVAIKENFAKLSDIISANGGRVVDLDEPKLTHVVLDKRDDSRRLQLMQRTSKPRRRNLVIAEFIEACIEEGTLLDEDEFAP